MKTNKYLFYGGIALLLLAGVGFYKLGLPAFFSNHGKTDEALTLSAVVLVGLALVVVMMAVLVIVYSVLGLANATQALALPEGSIRALIAFSLVLVFVCLAAFLYNGVSNVELSSGGKTLTKITEAQLTDLKAQFVVAYEPARKSDGSVETDTDGNSPLYNATYFSKRNKDADDFAKQIFTTLATVFVSVISFYFGSSATSSGVGAGAKAMRDGSDGGKKGDDTQSVLDDTQTAAHDAQWAVDRATDAVTNATALAAAAPSAKKSTADSDAAAAQKALDAAAQTAREARQQVEVARKAVADATAAGTDAAKASKAVADAVKARDAAKQLADKAQVSAAETERLLKKIKSDTGVV